MGTVHVVATPIGNLEDITLRALRVLAEVDLILAEDTRRTRVLLGRHGIATRMRSLNAQNESARLGEALERLRAGEVLALVSDAGTPLVSDPGARLVAAAAADGHRIEPVPGASALLAALAASGLRVHPFTFLGFLPRRAGAKRKLLSAYRGRPEALVIFESPRRVGATLAALAGQMGGERRACLARELTKLHEEIARGSLTELAERFGAGDVRGEITLVVEGAPAASAAVRGEAQTRAPGQGGDLERAIEERVARGQRPREIAAQLAPGSGVPRRALYARAVAARERAAACAAAADESGEPRSPAVEGERAPAALGEAPAANRKAPAANRKAPAANGKAPAANGKESAS